MRIAFNFQIFMLIFISAGRRAEAEHFDGSTTHRQQTMQLEKFRERELRCQKSEEQSHEDSQRFGFLSNMIGENKFIFLIKKY